MIRERDWELGGLNIVQNFGFLVRGFGKSLLQGRESGLEGTDFMRWGCRSGHESAKSEHGNGILLHHFGRTRHRFAESEQDSVGLRLKSIGSEHGCRTLTIAPQQFRRLPFPRGSATMAKA
jgi:hypothetical protein